MQHFVSLIIINPSLTNNIWIEAPKPRTSARGCRQSLGFAIRTWSPLTTSRTQSYDRRRGRRRRRRGAGRRREQVGPCRDGALLVARSDWPAIGGAARSPARAVRLLVGAGAPDAPRVLRSRAPTRTHSGPPHHRTRLVTARIRLCERSGRRRQDDGHPPEWSSGSRAAVDGVDAGARFRVQTPRVRYFRSDERGPADWNC